MAEEAKRQPHHLDMRRIDLLISHRRDFTKIIGGFGVELL